MKDQYTVQCFPLSTAFSSFYEMFMDCEAEIQWATMTTSAEGWQKNIEIDAILDGKEEVEIVVKVRPAATKNEETSD